MRQSEETAGLLALERRRSAGPRVGRRSRSAGPRATPPSASERWLRYLEGLALLLLFQLVGEALVGLLGIPIPGSVGGMALLLVALGARVVRLDWVEGAADGLLAVLALLFVPPGVGLVLYLELLREEWLPIAAATLVGAFAVLTVTGWVTQLLSRRGESRVLPESGERP